MLPLESLFLHYFDTHFSDNFLRQHDVSIIKREADLALRLALLCSYRVYIPAASYFESALCRSVVGAFSGLFETGCIRLIGRASGLAAFAEDKLQVYDADGPQYASYSSVLSGSKPLPPFRTRLISATEHLKEAWDRLGSSENFEQLLLGSTTVQLPLGFDKDFRCVPEQLGGRAFTPEYVLPLVPEASKNRFIRARIESLINREYFESFTQELSAGTVTDMIYFPTYVAMHPTEPCMPYDKTREAMRSLGILTDVISSSPPELLELRNHPKVIEAFSKSIDRVPSLTRPLQLRIPSVTRDSLESQLAALKSIPSGRRDANRYHKAVAMLLSDIFEENFGHCVLENEINEGRKRIDVAWPNYANDGFFSWVNAHLGAIHIYAECKNYSEDLGNPEVDQLIGRFAPWSTKVGFLVLRASKRKDRLMSRCRDAYKADQGLVIPLDDADLTVLVGLEEGTGPKSRSKWMHDRASQVML